ncbi:NfeD family protein [bacterium]|nr:NfeD family protein [bacterium]
MDFLESLLKPEVVWFIVGIVLLVAEFIIPGLIIGFFGAGALIVGLLNLIIPMSLNLQLVLFIIFSLVMLLTLRKSLNRIFMGRSHSAGEHDTEADEFAGERAIVTEQIKPNEPGKVEFHGTQWKAEADVEISKDAHVEVIAKNNITLKVKSI